MQIYRVGGAVRDRLLGIQVYDQDWVVVGATPEQMRAQGFQPVGKDFPVFLHPQTHEEYALARTERKSGRGYQGFAFHAAPDVTLEQDLLRRDLTINAMAEDPDGRLIDPYGGRRDLDARVLRHVSPAFAEDPLRVLRVARFAARFHHLGFTVAAETLALMAQLSAAAELADLSAERVWKELERALGEPSPQRFFDVLARCGGLDHWLPELQPLFAVDTPPPAHRHPPGGAVRTAARGDGRHPARTDPGAQGVPRRGAAAVPLGTGHARVHSMLRGAATGPVRRARPRPPPRTTAALYGWLPRAPARGRPGTVNTPLSRGGITATQGAGRRGL